MTHLSDLHFDPRNARKHNPRNIGMIAESLQQFGPARSIAIDELNVILAGNGVAEAAAQIGVEHVRVYDRATGILEPEPPDGAPYIFAVRVSDLTPDQKTMYALADNRTTDLSDFDPDVLQAFMDEGLDLEQFWFPEELDRLVNADDESFLDDALGAGDGASAWPGDGPESDPNTMTFKVTPEERDIIMGAVRIARSSDSSIDSTPAAIVAICEDYRCQHVS